MAAILRDEFHLTRFKLTFPHPEPFHNFLWKWPSWGFILYRFISSAYTLFAFIHYLATWTHPMTSAVFLATWTYFVLMLHFNFSLAVCVWIFIKERKRGKFTTSGAVKDGGSSGNNDNADNDRSDKTGSSDANVNNNTKNVESGVHSFDMNELNTKEKNFPWYLSVSWCLANMAYVCGVTTSILFYFLPDQTYTFVNINIYTLNAIFIYVDLYLSAIPLRILHAIYPVSLGLAYGLLNVVYWAANPSTNIVYHNILNWNEPTKASLIFLGTVLLILPCIQLIFFGVYRMTLGSFKWVYKHPYYLQQMPVPEVAQDK
ncbi:hypothetical protein LOTGIDRAFT_153660 [Lottia gigantea]|uniref:Protein rolling stone n=1 Tax=Lottia gigantea TaxID=225164 RepID=V4BQQ1_LOTGI|nr:hypothetical protein LOTGIDRAFT_153660 [Lottia gigantea]ESO91229.1 hypothetical protein LOTGIDRAFT_153660 [Lottia gigantea]